MTTKLLFSTLHGSKLYNLDHALSDHDVWEVWANKIPSPAKSIKQTIKGNLDLTRMNLSTFMLYADRSSHQVLECMFSTMYETDLLQHLRNNYYLNTSTFVPLYQRTIKAFGERDDLKSKRHALRMTYNFAEGLEYGRFNPTLKHSQRELILSATMDELDDMRHEYMKELGNEGSSRW